RGERDTHDVHQAAATTVGPGDRDGLPGPHDGPESRETCRQTPHGNAPETRRSRSACRPAARRGVAGGGRHPRTGTTVPTVSARTVRGDATTGRHRARV